jgi:hypothetical protein
VRDSFLYFNSPPEMIRQRMLLYVHYALSLHDLVANVDAAFVKRVLDLTERYRIVDAHQHHQANDLGRRLEIPKRISHPEDATERAYSPLKAVLSDTAFGHATLMR